MTHNQDPRCDVQRQYRCQIFPNRAIFCRTRLEEAAFFQEGRNNQLVLVRWKVKLDRLRDGFHGSSAWCMVLFVGNVTFSYRTCKFMYYTAMWIRCYGRGGRAPQGHERDDVSHGMVRCVMCDVLKRKAGACRGVLTYIDNMS